MLGPARGGTRAAMTSRRTRKVAANSDQRNAARAHWAGSGEDFASWRRDEVRTYKRSAEEIHRTLGELIERRARLLADLGVAASEGDRALTELMLEEVERVFSAFDTGKLPNQLLHG